MKLFLRRLRGIFGMGAIWAVPWALVGSLVIAIQLFLFGRANLFSSVRFALDVLLSAGLFWGVWGFVWGVAFATILSRAERNGVLETLEMRRVAAWGAIAGALPGLIPLVSFVITRKAGSFVDLAFVAMMSFVGAVFAAASLKLARSGSASQADVEHDIMADGPRTLPDERIVMQDFPKQTAKQAVEIR